MYWLPELDCRLTRHNEKGFYYVCTWTYVLQFNYPSAFMRPDGGGMDIDWTLIKKGLWENAQDAIRHGADHFRAYSDSNQSSNHDLKWGILSSHQAAECFSNILLIEITPNKAELINKNKPWFRSLSKSADLLLDGRSNGVLTSTELSLITLYKNLPPIRNELMHRTLPSVLDTSDAAISLLGTLRVARTRMGPCLEKYKFDSPPIEAEIHRAIPYQKNQSYIDLAYALLKESSTNYAIELFGLCELCGTYSIDMSTCQICYTEYDSATCPECSEDNFYEEWRSSLEIECDCGHVYIP